VRYQEAAKAREQKQKLDDLKELAWSHVKKKEMTSKIGDVAKASRRLRRVLRSAGGFSSWL
jgi:hypothetical protein